MSGRAWYCCNRRRGRAASRGRGGHAFDGCLGAGQDVDADQEDHGCEQQWAELEIRSAAIILRYSTLRRAKVPWVRAAQGHIVRRVSTIFFLCVVGGAGGRASEYGRVGSRTQGASRGKGRAIWYSAAQRDALPWTDSYIRFPFQRREEGRGAFCESFLHSTVLPCWG